MDINLLLIIMTVKVCVYTHEYVDYHYTIPVRMLDIPNCMINDHNCSQICVEVEGSFNCSCYSGYELQDDGANCTGS